MKKEYKKPKNNQNPYLQKSMWKTFFQKMRIKKFTENGKIIDQIIKKSK